MSPFAKRILNYALTVYVVLLASSLSGCGGGGGNGGSGNPTTYSVGGTVSGLSGSLVLQNNGGDDLTVTGNGSFTFSNQLANNHTYNVSVLVQPTGQTCSVTDGSGTVSGDIDNITITCVTSTHAIGGTVSGLNGTLVLRNNGGDDLTVTSDGSFTFSTEIYYSQTYSVSVFTQPTGQTCSISNGSGTASTTVNSIAVSCVTNTYSIGGVLNGLNGTLMLQNNGGDNLILTADGTFNFMTPVAFGDAYDVSVATQPNLQSCSVSSGSGIVSGDISDVSISCDTKPYWTWVGGKKSTIQGGVYGTLGTAAADNIPGSRYAAHSWKDDSGNLWLFGGYGYDSVGVFGYLNDLWKFDGNLWTWMGGSDVNGQSGLYGTLGFAEATNIPGARMGGVSWVDSSGNLWLFGGAGIDSTGHSGDLNDLWKFNGSQWAWMGGSNLIDQAGTYGTRGVAAVSNIPGGRGSAAAWTDNDGNLWLFGGFGRGSAVTIVGRLSDLWKFDGSQWTWISGSAAVNQAGIYGTQGVATVSNMPGSRDSAQAWTDKTGKLWLFGGIGADAYGTSGTLNDLWAFDGSLWTWVGGSNTVSQPGVYGTKNVPSLTNMPGARASATVVMDGNDTLWLFGGYGHDYIGNYGTLNDLWTFDGNQWTWVSGSNEVDQPGNYGTQGVAAESNMPGARSYAIGWIDGNGKFWFFGGDGRDYLGNPGELDDLWTYQP